MAVEGKRADVALPLAFTRLIVCACFIRSLFRIPPTRQLGSLSGFMAPAISRYNCSRV